MAPTYNPPRYAITGSITLPQGVVAYIILREEDTGHMYGVATNTSAEQSASILARFVRTWHRSVQGAMDEANKLRV